MSDMSYTPGGARKALRPIPLWAWIAVVAIVVIIVVLGGVFYQVDTTTKVPAVLGKTQQEATRILSAAGLRLGPVTKVETSTPPGRVLAQSPPPGTSARRGDLVAVRISVPMPGVVIPDVRGQEATAAVATMTGVGLTPMQSSIYSTAPVGTVVDQIPAAGIRISAGDEVSLIVSGGATSKSVTVPDVVAQASTVATKTVTDAGLTVRIVEGYSDTVGTGTVITQSPKGGTSAKAGSLVALLVSKGKGTSTVTVPDVVRDTQAQAESSLKAHGLTPQVAFAASSKPAGTVVGQFPAATSVVATSSPVIITVSKPGASLVTVPNLVGMGQAQAESTLSALGLTARFVSSISTSYPLGSVSAQVPAIGSKVPVGSDIVVGIVRGQPK